MEGTGNGIGGGSEDCASCWFIARRSDCGVGWCSDGCRLSRKMSECGSRGVASVSGELSEL
jgi:hypothetical protein